jgi:hypothetical protein
MAEEKAKAAELKSQMEKTEQMTLFEYGSIEELTSDGH